MVTTVRRPVVKKSGHRLPQALSLCLVLSLTGCGFVGTWDSGGEVLPPPTQEEIRSEAEDLEYERDLERHLGSEHYSYEEEIIPSGFFECYYDPTMNYDWHDDVLCDNGTEWIRPYLLENYDYVTQEEIMIEAAAFESYLNQQIIDEAPAAVEPTAQPGSRNILEQAERVRQECREDPSCRN